MFNLLQVGCAPKISNPTPSVQEWIVQTGVRIAQFVTFRSTYLVPESPQQSSNITIGIFEEYLAVDHFANARFELLDIFWMNANF